MTSAATDMIRSDVGYLEKQLDREVAPIKYLVMKASASAVASATKSLPESAFVGQQTITALPPMYDPTVMLALSRYSSAVSSCVDAIRENVSGYGHTLVPVYNFDDEEEAEVDAGRKKKIAEEYRELTNRLAIVGRGESITAIRGQLWTDRKMTGNAYLELVENYRGVISLIKRLPSDQVRLMPEDDELTRCTVRYPQVEPDGSIGYVELVEYRRFRRYVQGSYGYTGGAAYYRYFKQWGDPRVLDNETGVYVDEEKQRNFTGDGQPMPESRKASSIFHFGKGIDSPYGAPPWAPEMYAVLGVRGADVSNVKAIRQNGIPSVAMAVGGGRATAETQVRIQQFVDANARGDMNHSTMLVLEGESDNESDENKTRFTFHDLSNAQVRDILFGEYIGKMETRIYRSFRIPPIYLGEAGEYNKASADVSRSIGDQTVFAPMRDEDDEWFNSVLFTNWGVRHHSFQCNTPNITDDKTAVAILTALERTGGVTPVISRRFVNRFAPGLRLPTRFGKAPFDPNVPFSLTLAGLTGNKAGMDLNQQSSVVTPSANPGGRTKTPVVKALGIMAELDAALDEAIAEAEAEE